jgi:3-hydroxyisobutyrate dehydrogenase-like beta-hydroxyacid dehydrogenase
VDRSLETVGFIGLGQMGGGMVRNLLLAGVDLIVYDQRQDVSNKYVELGARIAISPANMAVQVKKFLCLPFTPKVDAVLFSPDDVTEGSKKGSMIIDTPKIYVSDAQTFQTRLKAFELSYSDCPISGLCLSGDRC